MGFLLYFFVIVLCVICVFLVLLVLIQKGRGGGLASAFGGGGGNTAFGSKTGDVLTWATSIVFGIFLVLSIATNLTANKIHEDRLGLANQQNQTPAAPAPAPATDNPLGVPVPQSSPPTSQP